MRPLGNLSASARTLDRSLKRREGANMADEAAAPSEEEVESASDPVPDSTADEVAADEATEAAVPREPMSPLKAATIVGVALVVAMGALAGWSGYRYYENRKA